MLESVQPSLRTKNIPILPLYSSYFTCLAWTDYRRLKGIEMNKDNWFISSRWHNVSVCPTKVLSTHRRPQWMEHWSVSAWDLGPFHRLFQAAHAITRFTTGLTFKRNCHACPMHLDIQSMSFCFISQWKYAALFSHPRARAIIKESSVVTRQIRNQQKESILIPGSMAELAVLRFARIALPDSHLLREDTNTFIDQTCRSPAMSSIHGQQKVPSPWALG